MFKKIFLLLAITFMYVTSAPPGVGQANVATAPPNCRPNQQVVNGQCRDIWGREVDWFNAVVVPPNCPPGQNYINGQCRDVWALRGKTESDAVNIVYSVADLEIKNVITAPPNCGPGQEFINGQCREVWAFGGVKVMGSQESAFDFDIKNVVTVPPNCPQGQEWINGECRDVWRQVPVKNVISVPDNCPSGQEFVQGQCRDIWALIVKSIYEIENNHQSELETLRGLISSLLSNNNVVGDVIKDPRNVVDVPNQCPSGFKADANGICRPIWN